MPFLLGLFAISIVTLFAGIKRKYYDTINLRGMIFCLIWLISGAVLLAVFPYQPIRYQVFLILPLAGFIGIVFGENHQPDSKKVPMIMKLYKYKYIFLIPLLAISCIYQGSLIYKWLAHPTRQMLRDSELLPEIIGNSAVLTGPYAQNMTIDNELKSVIYIFGLADKDMDLFERFPITHLAMDNGNLPVARKDYPFLTDAIEVERLFINYEEVIILRLPDSVLKTNGISYHKTDFEVAKDFSLKHQIDSSLVYINKLLEVNPGNKSALMLLIDQMLKTRQFSKALGFNERVVSFHPEDYEVIFNSAYYLYYISLVTRDPAMEIRANRLFQRAADIYPYLREKIDIAKSKLKSRIG